MEIHPRTLAATFRDMARETEQRAKAFRVGTQGHIGMLGEADGLRVAAEHLEQLADAEFERIMAEAAASGTHTRGMTDTPPYSDPGAYGATVR